MIAATRIRGRELERTPDLVDLVTAARDAGHEVMLIERPMPDAVSVAGIGRALDIVAAPGGVAVENADGKTIDFEPGENRVLAASLTAPTANRAARGPGSPRCCFVSRRSRSCGGAAAPLSSPQPRMPRRCWTSPPPQRERLLRASST